MLLSSKILIRCFYLLLIGLSLSTAHTGFAASPSTFPPQIFGQSFVPKYPNGITDPAQINNLINSITSRVNLVKSPPPDFPAEFIAGWKAQQRSMYINWIFGDIRNATSLSPVHSEVLDWLANDPVGRQFKINVGANTNICNYESYTINLTGRAIAWGDVEWSASTVLLHEAGHGYSKYYLNQNWDTAQIPDLIGSEATAIYLSTEDFSTSISSIASTYPVEWARMNELFPGFSGLSAQDGFALVTEARNARALGSSMTTIASALSATDQGLVSYAPQVFQDVQSSLEFRPIAVAGNLGAAAPVVSNTVADLSAKPVGLGELVSPPLELNAETLTPELAASEVARSSMTLGKAIGIAGSGVAILATGASAAKTVYDYQTGQTAQVGDDLSNTSLGLSSFLPGIGWVCVATGLSVNGVTAAYVETNNKWNDYQNTLAVAQGAQLMRTSILSQMSNGEISTLDALDALHSNNLIDSNLYETFRTNYLNANLAGLNPADNPTQAMAILTYGPGFYQMMTNPGYTSHFDQASSFQINQSAVEQTPGSSVVQLWNNPSTADQITQTALDSFTQNTNSIFTSSMFGDFQIPQDPPNVNTINYNGAQLPIDFNPNWGFEGANISVSTTDSSAQLPVTDYFPYSNPVGQPASNAFFDPPSYFDLGNLDAQLNANFGAIDYSGILPDTGASLDSLTSADGAYIGTPIGDYSTSGGGDVSTDAPIFDGTQVDVSDM